jgi:epoxyqueuosine reductase QueG
MGADLNLDQQVRRDARALGADFAGVADLTPARTPVEAQGGPMLAQFPRAISVGVVMPHAIVDQLQRHRDRAVAQAYRTHSYHILNARLDGIASQLASVVQRAGYQAFPVAASQMIDSERLVGLFSHKLAAHLAGLGWIGKSCMLITPEQGPRVRWASILTDAPLTVGQPMAERCEACDACVRSCPAQAFTGRSFRDDEPREARFDVTRCQAYQSLRDETAEVRACGMCVYVCPHGRGRRAPPSPAVSTADTVSPEGRRLV